MADAINTKKRGRKPLSASEKKRRIDHRRSDYKSTRICLGSEKPRWDDLKKTHNLNDREMATFLIDYYKHGEAAKGPGPSTSAVSAQQPGLSGSLRLPWINRLTSTPAITRGQQAKSPSVSGISERESSDDREIVMSGIEELKSEDEASKRVTEVTVEQISSRPSRPHISKNLPSSFIDPFEVSIDVTSIESDIDEDDDDYEPSIQISTVLPDEIQANAEDVAYEEAEFGLERLDESEDDTSSDEGSDIEGVKTVTTEEDCKQACSGEKCIVFVSQLIKLAQYTSVKCQTCGTSNVEVMDNYSGSAIYLSWVCKEGHVSHKWCSQPTINRRLPSGDFLICSTILTSGNNFSKMDLWASMLHLKFPSANKFHRIQTKYLVPTIETYWENHQQEVLSSLKEKELVVLGDGRNDSPGHCAQYCSYTLMEQETKQILTLKTLDKRVTDRKSGNMEKVGFKAAMDELKIRGMNVAEVVTDAHLGIGAMMKTTFPDVKHSHDIWHAAKNLTKKLSKIAQKKQNNKLNAWVKDIVNHFWFSCKTAENYGQFVGIWSGVLHHIVNEHEWIIDHSDDGVFKCYHEQLDDEERVKPWLHRKDDSHIIKDLAGIVLDKRLLGKVGYLLNFRSTADLEGFHQHILMYCAKRFAYSPPIYRVRNLLAALDHNMHANRTAIVNKDGSLRLQRVWNKKSGRWSVYQVKEKKNYIYIDTLLFEALNRQLTDQVGMYQKRPLRLDDPRRISQHLAPVAPPSSGELFVEQRSRFT